MCTIRRMVRVEFCTTFYYMKTAIDIDFYIAVLIMEQLLVDFGCFDLK